MINCGPILFSITEERGGEGGGRTVAGLHCDEYQNINP